VVYLGSQFVVLPELDCRDDVNSSMACIVTYAVGMWMCVQILKAATYSHFELIRIYSLEWLHSMHHRY